MTKIDQGKVTPNETDHEVQKLTQHFYDKTDSPKKADWPGAETMLQNQVMALNDQFDQCIIKAQNDLKTFLPLAIEAQDKCRMAIETIIYYHNQFPQDDSVKEQNLQPTKKPIIRSAMHSKGIQ